MYTVSHVEHHTMVLFGLVSLTGLNNEWTVSLHDITDAVQTETPSEATRPLFKLTSLGLFQLNMITSRFTFDASAGNYK